MRPIKYRAWDGLLGEMVYIRKTEQYDDSLLLRFEKHFETETPIYMQFTGLYDCNGKEIYESDIVAITLKDESALKAKEYNWNWLEEKMAIKYDDGGWKLYIPHKKMNFPMLFYTHSLIVEVIGNVYENSELLQS